MASRPGAAERRKRYIAALSDRDWNRIRALAREVTPGYTPARLDDLDAKTIAVGVTQPGGESYVSGERIGEIAVRPDWKLPVIVWEKEQKGRR
jgi:hypothetical protein